jgi:hypothetical protein
MIGIGSTPFRRNRSHFGVLGIVIPLAIATTCLHYSVLRRFSLYSSPPPERFLSPIASLVHQCGLLAQDAIAVDSDKLWN